MYGIQGYEAFFVSAVVFAMTPGLDTAFLINKAISRGRRPAMLASLGINAGVMVHTLAAALGLSALLAASPVAFSVIKWAGAAYLCWLGVESFMTKRRSFASLSVSTPPVESPWTSFRTGMIANLLNPKVILFVLAFFPQFIEPAEAGSPLPFLILGATYAAIGTVWYLILAYFASALGTRLMTHPTYAKVLDRVSGSIFILLGAKIAFD